MDTAGRRAIRLPTCTIKIVIQIQAVEWAAGVSTGDGFVHSASNRTELFH
jgi:hypothetical protein